MRKNYERRAVKRKAQPAINTFEKEKRAKNKGSSNQRFMPFDDVTGYMTLQSDMIPILLNRLPIFQQFHVIFGCY